MSADIPVLLSAIVLDASNNALRITEGAFTSTTSIPVGTYFLRGDGAADDLLLAIKTALETNTAPRVSVNTYTVAVAWSTDPAAVSAVVTVTRASGADNFGVLYADAATTFDQALIGFPNTNDTVDALVKTSALSPSSAWVSPAVVEEFEPEDEEDAFANRAASGVVNAGSRGGPYEVRRLSFAFIDEKRAHHAKIAAASLAALGPGAFSRTFSRLKAGRAFELHFGTATGTVLAALSATTEQGAGWHLSKDTVDDGFAPSRLSVAVPLYSWSLRLWGHV